MTIRPIPLLLLLSLTGIAHAQEEGSKPPASNGIYISGNGIERDDSSRHSTASIGFHYGRPFGGFAETQDKGFVGLGAQVAFHIKELPIDAGFGLGWDWLERSTSDVSVNRTSLPDTTGELVVKNQSYAILPMVRYRPWQGRFMCYAEVFGGARLFMTNSRVDVDSRDKPVMRRYQEADVSLEWGTALGIMVRTGKNLIVEARYARSWGGQARFVDHGSISVSDTGDLTFGTNRSTTDAWRFQIGLAQYF